MDLTWQGPFSFHGLIRDRANHEIYNKAGVYLWVERLPGEEERILYVGKATGKPSLGMRHFIHYMHFIGGLWNIPKDFPSGEKEWIPSLDSRINPDSNAVLEVILDREKFKKHVDRAFAYIEHLKIYLCPLENLGSFELANVERNLLFNLKPAATKQGTMTSPKDPIEFTHKKALWASEAIRKLIGKGFSEI
jgi:hypothetical protein